MLQKRKILLSAMEKTRKLPRLAFMGFIPIIIASLIPLPILIVSMLHTWGTLFLGLFWLEGIFLSLKVIEKIEYKANIINAILHLDNIEEFDRIGKESE